MVTGAHRRVLTVITVELDREGPIPPYQQLAAILRELIESGKIPPDRPLPSKRTLMQEYGIAGKTVDKAIDVLRADGLVRTVRGMGIYVTGRR
jgi:GntR family transcriptional regulator